MATGEYVSPCPLRIDLPAALLALCQLGLVPGPGSSNFWEGFLGSEVNTTAESYLEFSLPVPQNFLMCSYSFLSVFPGTCDKGDNFHLADGT